MSTTARITNQNDGGTFDNSGNEVAFSDGFIVGGIVPTHIVEERELTFTSSRFRAQHKELLQQANTFLGTWKHAGAIYLDVVQHVDNASIAQTLGKTRGEIAIWDCGNQAEVTL